jgi:hypothetical protein
LGYSASALLLTCLGIAVFVPIVLPLIVLATLASYVSAFGMPESQKRVLRLAICSRNSGPAMLTVLSIPNLHGDAFVMVGLGIIVQMSLSFPLAFLLGKRA